MSWTKALPWIATTLGGPLAGIAVDLIAPVLGISEPTAQKIRDGIEAVAAGPEGALKLRTVEAELKLKLAQLGYDSIEKLEGIALKAAEAVNVTMQAETKAEKWPQYSWRPAIGFAVALNVILVTLTVGIAFITAMITGHTEHLKYIPEMVFAMTSLIAVVSPILGIASWFRGKGKMEGAI